MVDFLFSCLSYNTIGDPTNITINFFVASFGSINELSMVSFLSFFVKIKSFHIILSLKKKAKMEFLKSKEKTTKSHFYLFSEILNHLTFEKERRKNEKRILLFFFFPWKKKHKKKLQKKMYWKGGERSWNGHKKRKETVSIVKETLWHFEWNNTVNFKYSSFCLPSKGLGFYVSFQKKISPLRPSQYFFLKEDGVWQYYEGWCGGILRGETVVSRFGTSGYCEEEQIWWSKSSGAESFRVR